jgi:hypothetical protein
MNPDDPDSTLENSNADATIPRSSLPRPGDPAPPMAHGAPPNEPDPSPAVELIVVPEFIAAVPEITPSEALTPPPAFTTTPVPPSPTTWIEPPNPYPAVDGNHFSPTLSEDLDQTTYRSGFPSVPAGPSAPYAEEPVDLDMLAPPPPMKKPKSNRWIVPVSLVGAAAIGLTGALMLGSGSGSSSADTPEIVAVVPGPAGSGTATVTWAAGGSDPDDASGSFEVVAIPADGSCTAQGATTCEITGLREGTTYRFEVASISGDSRSNASPASAPMFIPGPTGFSDVPDDSFSAAAISWLRARGVTNGYAGDRTVFNPDGVLTRGEMALFLFRVVDPGGNAPPHGFTDVTEPGELDDAVAWLKDEGITTGYGGDSTVFNPTGEVERGQLAVALYRMAAGRPATSPHGFTDVDPESFYDEAIGWMKAQAITTGFAGDTSVFNPTGAVTRSQLATFLFRLVATPDAWGSGAEPPAL